MKKIKVLIISVFVLILGVFLYFNIITPIQIKLTTVMCQNWDATYVGIKAFEEYYANGNYDKDTTILHGFNGKLPSENPKDYMNVYISLQGQNRSCFEAFTVDGYISNIAIYGDMALYSTTVSSVETMQIFRCSEKEGTLVLNIFVGNHTDEQIKEFIQSITIQVNSEGSIFGKRDTIISLADFEEIIIER